MQKDISETVTKSIIADLEKGAVPWAKPWKGGNTGGIMPVNYATRCAYNGINVLILWATRDDRAYPTPEWLTFKQAQSLKASVKKGEKGTRIVFSKKLTIEEEEKTRDISMLKTFYVFNTAQIEGLPTQPEDPKPEGTTPQFIEATKADIRHGGDKAFYVPSRDYIQMPPLPAFESVESYHCTVLHELGHWSGSKYRLDRDLSGRFGNQSCAAEELVAELTAAFLCAHLGIKGELRHVGYIDHWLTLLKGDSRAIFTAASKASQAANYIRSFSETMEK